MKFLFIIKKWSNFYFFIQNFSEWHLSNRKNYNEFWKKELKGLTKKEKESLKKFKIIHQKYGFNKKYPYLGSFFYLKKDPWKALEKHLSRRELLCLKNIFSIFRPKFEVLYKKDMPLLKKWRKKLEKKVNNESLINPINKILSTLYSAPLLERDIKIYLLFSSPTMLGGGGCIENNKAVTLEISRYPLKKNKSAIGVMWHEVIHAHFENYYFLPLLYESFPNDQKTIDLIEETTVRAVFFPGGILEKRFLKTHTPASDIPKKYNRSFLKFKKLVGKHIKENKPFNKEYIKKSLPLLSTLRGIIH